ncbi:MAG: deoxyribonuclease IV [Thermoanaerobaculia bacterium]
MPIRFSTTTDLLGAHVSTAGGLATAYGRGVTIGANALAIFSKNSNQWAAKPLSPDDVAAFSAARAASGIGPAIAHASYLINLAAPQDELWRKSIDAMVIELERASLLELDGVVLHPGAHVGEGIDKGIDRIARALDAVHARTPGCRVPILLETSAGQGSSLGCSFAELGRMLALVGAPRRIGVCFDTCHVFASGYDIRTERGWKATIDEMLEHVPLERIGAFHLNDSKRELGSRVDRHEHIGKGHIGTDAFGFLLNDSRFDGIPKVLETPKPTEFDADIENLATLRALLRSRAKGERREARSRPNGRPKGGPNCRPEAKGQRPEQAKGHTAAEGPRSKQVGSKAIPAKSDAAKKPRRAAAKDR